MKRLALVVGLGLCGAVSARTYNYQDVPVGEKSFGMGTAAMAVDDPDTGVMFHNPALLANSEHTQISASLSAFSRIDTRTGQFVSIFKSARDNISRSGYTAIPSMVGGHLKYKDWVWGGTVLVPFSFANSGKLDLDQFNTASFESKDESMWLGMFASRQVSPRHSFGISGFYLSRTNNEKFFFINKQSPFRIHYFESGFGASGLAFVLGGVYRLSDEWRLGYSVRPPAILFGGDAFVVDAASDADSVKDTRARTDFYPMPWKLSAGASWQPTPKFLLAADVHWYSRLHNSLDGRIAQTTPEFRIDAKAIANVSIGAEYLAWKEVGLRLGFFTNLSAAESVPLTLSAINDRVNMIGGTAAIVFSKKEGTISLGGYVQGGQGRAASISETRGSAVPRSNYLYGLVSGSSYKF